MASQKPNPSSNRFAELAKLGPDGAPKKPSGSSDAFAALANSGNLMASPVSEGLSLGSRLNTPAPAAIQAEGQQFQTLRQPQDAIEQEDTEMGDDSGRLTTQIRSPRITAEPEDGAQGPQDGQDDAIPEQLTGLDINDDRMDDDVSAPNPPPKQRLNATQQHEQHMASLDQWFRKRAAISSDDEDAGHAGNKRTRTKAAGPEPEPEATFQTPGAAPAPAVVDELADMNRRQIKNLGELRWCAIRVGASGIIIGNPFNPTTGYTMKVGIEAGREGLPELTLSCRVNKASSVSNKAKKGAHVHIQNVSNQSVSGKADERHDFEATWRPGVWSAGSYMMDMMEIKGMTESKLGDHPHDQFIVNQCPKDKDGKKALLPKVMAITFAAGARRISNDVKDEYWKGLPLDVITTFRKIFLQQENFQITIWLTLYMDVETAMLQWGRYLQYQVNNHVPPFAQYRDADGAMNLHWDTTELINTFGHSMYAIYHRSNGIEDTTRDPKDYYKFPRRLIFDTFDELAVTTAMPIVRDVQAQRNLVAHINTNTFGLFCVRIPHVSRQKKMDDMMYCFVRMKAKTDKTKAGKAPPPGSHVQVLPNNAIPGVKPHIFPDGSSEWHHGVVHDTPTDCLRTGTDFCIWLTRNPRAGKLDTYGELRNLDDSRLTPAFIEVKVDTTAAERDLIGAYRLADPRYEPEALGDLRNTIMQEPSKIKHKIVNLCTKNPVTWDQYKEKMRQACGDNAEQYQVIVSLERVDNSLVSVAGPPGTGKTLLLARTVIGALTQDQMCLVTGPLNIAVDNAANKVWEELEPKYKSGTSEKFLMRVETKGAELRAFLAVKNYKDLQLQSDDVDERPVLNEMKTEDAVELAKHMAESIRDVEANRKELEELWTKCNDYSKAVRIQSDNAARKVTKVPIKMTSGWHIHRILTRDREKALLQFTALRAVWTKLPPQNQEWIENQMALPKTQSIASPEFDPELYEAMLSDMITEEEFDARVKQGLIKSPDARRQYFRYTELVELYVEKNGKLPRHLREEFEYQWMIVMGDVLASLDAVFTTCNNAGSDLLDVGIKPDAVFCDESGQVNLASFAVVVTSHTGWRVIYIFGDDQQLRPFTQAGRLSEMAEYARIAILSLLQSKGCTVIRLRVQYRMAPAIVEWPNAYFYKGELTIHPALLQDNAYRAAGRKISKDIYGLGRGSEYWHINVMNAKSEAQQNNTTLVNHASSNAVVNLVGHFMAEGIELSDIGILTYYLGQKYLHTMKLRRAARGSAQPWDVDSIDLSTVDAYQGKEIRVGIVDLVVAHDNSPEEATGNEDDDLDDDLVRANALGVVSSHVKDAHRLCCALTRFKDILVVISKVSSLGVTAKVKQKVSQGALSQMFRNAMDRGLVYNDNISPNDSPAYLQLTKDWTEKDRRQRDDRIRLQQQTYLNHSLKVARKARLFDEERHEMPVYMTRFGRTSKPIDMEAAATAVEPAADAPKRTRQEIYNDPTAGITFNKVPQKERKVALKAEKARAAKAKEQEELLKEEKKVIKMTEEETAAAKEINRKAQEHASGGSSGV